MCIICDWLLADGDLEECDHDVKDLFDRQMRCKLQTVSVAFAEYYALISGAEPLGGAAYRRHKAALRREYAELQQYPDLVRRRPVTFGAVCDQIGLSDKGFSADTLSHYCAVYDLFMARWVNQGTKLHVPN